MGIYQHEGLDIRDERFEAESSSVDIGGEGSPQTQAVGTGLLLNNPPRLGLASLGVQQVGDELAMCDVTHGTG